MDDMKQFAREYADHATAVVDPIIQKVFVRLHLALGSFGCDLPQVKKHGRKTS